MTFDEARTHIVAVVTASPGSLNRDRMAVRLGEEGGDLAFAELEFDSLAAMELCIEVEERTGVEIDLADLATHTSVNALARLLASRTEGA